MKILAAILILSGMAASAQTRPVKLSSGVMAGQLVHKVMPQYPKEAAWAHVSGSVVLHVIIGEDGIPHDITVVSGPEMLRQPYINAVKQWVYKPYLLNGKSTPVDTTITLILDFGGLVLPKGRIHLSSGELAGLTLEHPVPRYPHFNSKDHITGASLFHVVIGRDGHVLQLDVISGPSKRLPFEIDAVKQYVYKPYLVHGEAVEVDSTVTLQPSFGG